MKNMEKVKEVTKRSIAMILAITFLLARTTSSTTFASMSIENNEYTAIMTENLVMYGKSFEIHGQLKEDVSIPDMHSGILSVLEEETQISDEAFVANATEYSNDNSIYSKEKVNINCSVANINGNVVAEDNITINAGEFIGENYIIIYSVNGDININISSMTFNGMIYAPNGNVTINGSKIEINGMIVAKNANLYVNTFVITANNYSGSLMNILKTYRNDKLLTLTGYTYEEDIVVGFESDAEFANVDLYIRNDDNSSFEYLATTTETEYTISEYDFEKYMDIMAIAHTKYGEMFESTLMTVGYSNEEYAEKLASYCNDADEDGIQDGYEVWYSKTNPQSSDTDGDGLDDYIECFYLCTDPNVVNVDCDTDGDSISDKTEINKGTHPYLKDTDFDGYIDSVDTEVLVYNEGAENYIDYTEDRVVGLFDNVNTWIDDNGNVYQYIYNFINDNVEYTMINGVMTKYYYNIQNQLTAVVTINEDVMDAVTYTYDGEVLSSVVYNGLIYEFTLDEASQRISIAGQEYKNVTYGEIENVTTYGNGFEKKVKYNELGEAVEIYYNDEFAFSCEYDENGLVTKVIDYMTGYGQIYTYLEDGNIDAITGNNYRIVYEYSDEEYVINYSVADKEYIQMVYNDIEDEYASQYSSLLISGGLHENVETDEGDVEYKITDTITGDKVFTNLLTYDNDIIVKMVSNNGDEWVYEYAKDGKISRILQNDTEVVKYYYDNLGRVIREENALADRSYEYVYNEDSNIEKSITYEYASGELTDILSEDTYAYESVWKDQVTQINNDEITYDEVGNPLQYRNGIEFSWNGKLLADVATSQFDVHYTYNSEGIRNSKTVNGVTTEYVIEGNDIVFEINEENVIAYIYDSDMNVIGMICDDETYYFEKNIQGDVIRILDSKGNIQCEYVYDAWGRTIFVDGNEKLAKKNPFRYRSYYFDEETGLYYVESRYYDSETGRFINADKIEEIVWDYTNLNMYAYCENDPVNYYDPTGEAAIWLKTFISRSVYSDTYDASVLVATNTSWISDMGKGGSHIKYIIDSPEEFIERWNSITYMNAVVIMGHGTPNSIKFGSERFTVDDVDELDTKTIKFVWLLSCNTGHYDCRTSNIARKLSTKLNGGCVIGPDGLIDTGKCNNRFYAFVYAGGEWDDYAENRLHSYKWILYKNGKFDLTLTSMLAVMNAGKTSEGESIYTISDMLVSKGYVTYK